MTQSRSAQLDLIRRMERIGSLGHERTWPHVSGRICKKSQFTHFFSLCVCVCWGGGRDPMFENLASCEKIARPVSSCVTSIRIGRTKSEEGATRAAPESSGQRRENGEERRGISCRLNGFLESGTRLRTGCGRRFVLLALRLFPDPSVFTCGVARRRYMDGQLLSSSAISKELLSFISPLSKHLRSCQAVCKEL